MAQRVSLVRPALARGTRRRAELTARCADSVTGGAGIMQTTESPPGGLVPSSGAGSRARRVRLVALIVYDGSAWWDCSIKYVYVRLVHRVGWSRQRVLVIYGESTWLAGGTRIVHLVGWWYTEGPPGGLVVYGGFIFGAWWYTEGPFLWEGGIWRVHFCGMVVNGGSIFVGWWYTEGPFLVDVVYRGPTWWDGPVKGQGWVV